MRWLWPVIVLCFAAPLHTRAGEWVDEEQLGVFIFRADFALRDVSSTVQDLGELQKDIEATLSLRCRERPIEIHLLRNRWAYSQYVRRHVPEGVGRPALFVAGSDAGRVYAYRRPDLQTDLRHETTHALLHNALPYVPLWLDEGMAEYFEQPAARRGGGSPHRRNLQWAIRFGWRPNLARLEAISTQSELTGDDYRDAWGWVHFLLHGPPEAREALDEFLATIPTGREPTALSVTLRQRIPNLEDAVITHLK